MLLLCPPFASNVIRSLLVILYYNLKRLLYKCTDRIPYPFFNDFPQLFFGISSHLLQLFAPCHNTKSFSTFILFPLVLLGVKESALCERTISLLLVITIPISRMDHFLLSPFFNRRMSEGSQMTRLPTELICTVH